MKAAWIAYFCLALAQPAAAALAGEAVDTLDYFLQGDDREERWTLGGIDVLPGLDPEGTGARTYLESKFSNPECYEVYRVTDADIELRYEVLRAGGPKGDGNWIRRFEEIVDGDRAPGAIWMKRRMVPGGEGVLSTFRLDRFAYDEGKKAYVFDAAGSPARMQIYASVDWADAGWGERNRSGLDLGRVLRLTSEWQAEGKIIETYDYARGKGLTGWRWLERVSSLPPVAGDKSGKRFECMGGPVIVEPAGAGGEPPKILRCAEDGTPKGKPLEVVRFASHWRPELGRQWYVVCRDLAREGTLERKEERVIPGFLLPEWEAKPGAMIADLPYVNTHPAVGFDVPLDLKGMQVQGNAIVDAAGQETWRITPFEGRGARVTLAAGSLLAGELEGNRLCCGRYGRELPGGPARVQRGNAEARQGRKDP